jgi:hypothetical protein
MTRSGAGSHGASLLRASSLCLGGLAWNEPMIREAEQNGNAFAAVWHVDRLIAARPDDWLLYARSARAW